MTLALPSTFVEKIKVKLANFDDFSKMWMFWGFRMLG